MFVVVVVVAVVFVVLLVLLLICRPFPPLLQCQSLSLIVLYRTCIVLIVLRAFLTVDLTVNFSRFVTYFIDFSHHDDVNDTRFASLVVRGQHNENFYGVNRSSFLSLFFYCDVTGSSRSPATSEEVPVHQSVHSAEDMISTAYMGPFAIREAHCHL